jgi:CheY-like chemotaxis protein
LERKPSVLIVDAGEETREVLGTVLQRRGMETLWAGEPEEALQLAQTQQPDVIILDLQVEGTSADQLCRPFAQKMQESQTPLVVLGSVRRADRMFRGEFFPKPYHYAPLIRKIEELVQGKSEAGRPSG